jgi:hypothetical protein
MNPFFILVEVTTSLVGGHKAARTALAQKRTSMRGIRHSALPPKKGNAQRHHRCLLSAKSGQSNFRKILLSHSRLWRQRLPRPRFMVVTALNKQARTVSRNGDLRGKGLPIAEGAAMAYLTWQVRTS